MRETLGLPVVVERSFKGRQSNCSHAMLVLYSSSRRAECLDCGVELDPFDVLFTYARKKQRVLRDMDQEAAKAEFEAAGTANVEAKDCLTCRWEPEWFRLLAYSDSAICPFLCVKGRLVLRFENGAKTVAFIADKGLAITIFPCRYHELKRSLQAANAPETTQPRTPNQTGAHHVKHIRRPRHCAALRRIGARP
jgi:hypothetical protein